MTSKVGGRGLPSAQDTGRSDGHDTLAVLLSDFAREVQQRRDPAATLAEIVRAAVELVPGCDEGSVSVVLGRRAVTSEAASGPLPLVIDELQMRLKQGPCLDAAYDEVTVRVSDMATETRWPLFARAAADAGAGGMLSFQLYVEDDNLGALNLFSYGAGAFTDESEHVGLLFAAHASVAYSSSRRQSRLVSTIATRQLIGQAQGILMERHRLTPDQSFALLTRVSQHTNIKLRDIAERLVLSGEMDQPPSS